MTFGVRTPLLIAVASVASACGAGSPVPEGTRPQDDIQCTTALLLVVPPWSPTPRAVADLEQFLEEEGLSVQLTVAADPGQEARLRLDGCRAEGHGALVIAGPEDAPVVLESLRFQLERIEDELIARPVAELMSSEEGRTKLADVAAAAADMEWVDLDLSCPEGDPSAQDASVRKSGGAVQWGSVTCPGPRRIEGPLANEDERVEFQIIPAGGSAGGMSLLHVVAPAVHASGTCSCAVCIRPDGWDLGECTADNGWQCSNPCPPQ